MTPNTAAQEATAGTRQGEPEARLRRRLQEARDHGEEIMLLMGLMSPDMDPAAVAGIQAE